MDARGASLYSSDFAGEMRELVKSVLRLLFCEDRIVEIIGEREAAAAKDPDAGRARVRRFPEEGACCG